MVTDRFEFTQKGSSVVSVYILKTKKVFFRHSRFCRYTRTVGIPNLEFYYCHSILNMSVQIKFREAKNNCIQMNTVFYSF